ncbi:hypothetical protein ACFWOY_32470 [Streptomyces sp. NPDC058423]
MVLIKEELAGGALFEGIHDVIERCALLGIGSEDTDVNDEELRPVDDE